MRWWRGASSTRVGRVGRSRSRGGGSDAGREVSSTDDMFLGAWWDEMTHFTHPSSSGLPLKQATALADLTRAGASQVIAPARATLAGWQR